MDATSRSQSEREMQRVQANREELVERLSRVIRDDGTADPLKGLMLRRASAPTELAHGMSYLSL